MPDVTSTAVDLRAYQKTPAKIDIETSRKPGTSERLDALHGRSTFEVVEVKFRRILKKSLSPFVVIAASIYFLIDALFFSVVKPLSRRLARLPIFTALASRIAARGPYVTLALFLVPLIILEPVKPVGIYLIASGHSRYGALVLSVGEVLKILVVERIFQVGRDKLMTIPAFAWAYNFVIE